MSQLHTFLEWKVIWRSEISLSEEIELWVATTRLGVVGLEAAVLTLADAFFLGFPSSRLRGCCSFGFKLLWPDRLPGCGHCWRSGRLRDRLGREIWGSSDGGLGDTSPSGDVIRPLAQVRLIGTGPGPLSFQSSRVACGGTLSTTPGRLLCKSHPRFFPLNTAPVVRRVIPPQPQD
jgi:hypothetical protein